MFAVPRLAFRAIRVLLICMALATAMPVATAVARGTITESTSVVTGYRGVARPVRSRQAEHPHTDATRYAKRKPVLPQPVLREIRVQTEFAFLLNCSWLC